MWLVAKTKVIVASRRASQLSMGRGGGGGGNVKFKPMEALHLGKRYCCIHYFPKR